MNKEERIEITSPVKTYIPLVLFSFLATIILLYKLVIELYNYFTSDTNNLIGIIFSIPIIFILSQTFFWFIFGRETVIVEFDKVLFVRTNGLITLKRIVLFSEIKNISLNPLTFPSDTFIDRKRQFIREMQGAMFFWYNMGKVEFKIKNSYRTFFNGMSKQKAAETVNILQDRINRK